MKIGSRVLVLFRPPGPGVEALLEPGVIEGVCYDTIIRLDKPYRSRHRKEPISEVRYPLAERQPIGTLGKVPYFPKRTGRVIKCERQYVVKLDARCQDSGRELRYSVPRKMLLEGAPPAEASGGRRASSRTCGTSRTTGPRCT